MYEPPNTKLRSRQQNEYTHALEAARNYNESMHFNVFDTARGGFWLRIGNRVNEGDAEMSCCVCLKTVLGMTEYSDVIQDRVPLSVRQG